MREIITPLIFLHIMQVFVTHCESQTVSLLLLV